MSILDEQQNPGDAPTSEPASISLPMRLFTTGLYTGYAPFAPGSVGSLLGILIYFVPGFDQPYVILPAVAVIFFLGVHGVSKMERVYGRDPRIVVIDEIVGLWISLALLPKHPGVVALAFFLFRLLDTVKPYPARQSERLRGGWGIMIDDVIAGVYTNLLLRLFLYFYQL
ncbi:MAG: phosphatidylglycerophosphatase A [Bacteroidota bacterium]